MEVGEGFTCISRSVKMVPISFYREVILCGQGQAVLHHPPYVSLLPWVKVGEGLIRIIHSVSPSTLGEGGGGAHLHHPQCLPLPWVEVGEGLIRIIHSVSPSTLGESGGGAHLYYPQCVSLYLG